MSESILTNPFTTVLGALGLALAGVLLQQLISFVRLRVATWAWRQLPGPASDSTFWGNIGQYFSRHGENFHRQVAVDYGSVVRLTGLLGNPILYVADPKALHTMLIDEEEIFQETDIALQITQMAFGTTLLSITGRHHAKQRKLLSPVFSVNHMRHMLPLFYDIGRKIRDAISAQVGDAKAEVNVLGWMNRSALEFIGQGGLGYSFDPLVTESKDAYADTLKSLLPNLDVNLRFQFLIPLARQIFPTWLLRVFVNTFSATSNIGRTRDNINEMFERAKEVYASKKRALAAGEAELAKQTAQGKDLVSILMQANSVADEDQRLPEEDVVSLMSMFTFAATETSSNALSRILDVLAKHPDYQARLREELLEARAADGLLSYDELNHLPLLDGVIRETLRLHPPVTMLFRVATRDTVLPLSEPVFTTDGKQIASIAVPKGSQFLLGFMGCNLSRTIWGEDALEWKPDRWVSDLPSAVTKARIPGVYSNVMSFSGGKRSCIGFKFSEMEIKVVLSVLVPNLTFELTDKPIQWNVGTVGFPTVGKESATPQLPLKVARYALPGSGV
ncbi:cytochrome P450 [Rhodofomes roseus]|uniref:Cytochrome P450 n=1 Tax=Rhodofomes roseus TaxID=34475 RepID=A0ABQ8K6A3_9APHY|nr:cytochrome P450 [Rhodofomes roseus]KAH9832026.1 cytochrome P450 [Rhodofomes roseus]